jgi:hypothetical protein
MWSSIKYSEIQTWPLRITDTHDSGSTCLHAHHLESVAEVNSARIY